MADHCFPCILFEWLLLMAYRIICTEKESRDLHFVFENKDRDKKDTNASLIGKDLTTCVHVQ